MNWIKKLFSKKETTKQCDIHSVIGSYSVPKNPNTNETRRIFWNCNKLQKVYMKDVDGKVYDITKK